MFVTAWRQTGPGERSDDVVELKECEMSKLSPLQIVKRDFQSKENLVDNLVSRLERFEDEEEGAFRERLLLVSNRKLLKLHKAATKVEAFGGKEKLVDAIVDLTKKDIKSYDLVGVQKNQEEAALQAVIDDAKARGVDAKTIKAAQKCFERHIPAFILRAA